MIHFQWILLHALCDGGGSCVHAGDPWRVHRPPGPKGTFTASSSGSGGGKTETIPTRCFKKYFHNLTQIAMSKQTAALKATKAIAVANPQMIGKRIKLFDEIKKIPGKTWPRGVHNTLPNRTGNGLNPFSAKYGRWNTEIIPPAYSSGDGYRKAASKETEYDYHLTDAVYQKTTSKWKRRG